MAQRVWEEIEADEAAGFVRPPKRQAGEPIVMPMYEVTPEEAKRNAEYYQNLKNERKRRNAQCKIERDEKLKSLGLENCDQASI